MFQYIIFLLIYSLAILQFSASVVPIDIVKSSGSNNLYVLRNGFRHHIHRSELKHFSYHGNIQVLTDDQIFKYKKSMPYNQYVRSRMHRIMQPDAFDFFDSSGHISKTGNDSSLSLNEIKIVARGKTKRWSNIAYANYSWVEVQRVAARCISDAFYFHYFEGFSALNASISTGLSGRGRFLNSGCWFQPVDIFDSNSGSARSLRTGIFVNVGKTFVGRNRC